MPQLLILTEAHGHGGVQTVTTVLQQQLQARGWTVETAAVRGQPLRAGALWRAARSADVLLACNNFRPAYVAVLLGLLSRRPSVVWVHGPVREVLRAVQGEPPTDRLQALKHRWQRWVLQHAHARVCVSETSRQSLLAWLAPQAADARLIRNPAPACVPLSPEAWTSSGEPGAQPPHDAPVELGLVARLSAEKRPGLALQALRLLPAHHRLTLIGEGPLQATLAAEGGDLLHSGRLKMPGAHTVTVRTYTNWQLSLLCSAYEGYPMAALESLAAGVPCVGPPLPALQEMLGPRAAEWLAEDDSPAALARAIERCLQTPLAQRQSSAQAIARQHDADTFGLRWHRLLLALMPPSTPQGTA
jgi:glycosyltransferase involved in cell wall biosynthesis